MFTQHQQIPRSPLASTLTLAFHVGLALVAIGTIAVPNVPKIASRESITYVSAARLPDFEIPLPPPLPPPPRLEVPRPEPPKAFDTPAVKPPPRALVPERRVLEQPRETPPLPRLRAVVVGAFTDSPVARKPERTPDVVVAGFESASAQAARARRELSAIEGFETRTSQPTTARTGAVSEGGFSASPAAMAQRPASVVTGAAGFGASSSATAQRPAAVVTGAAGFGADPPKSAAVAALRQPPSSSGFGETAAAPVRAAAAPTPPRADRPVEVIFKPVPAYTDEARARRIEGEVSLDVEFTADGKVRVLRVLQGLGHGLDDMATRAAQQIRFRPATRNGVPVDFRATVNILFRLT